MTFEEWITFIFDHPITKPEWYWDINAVAEPSDLDESHIVAYLTRTFEEADKILQPFSDAQVGQGLNLLVSGSCSNYMFALREPQVPLPDRLRALAAIENLYATCFARRCSPHLSHLDEPGINPLNSVCYMWWDVLPLHGLIEHQPHRSDSADLDRMCLRVMERTLSLDSVACRESALHGLGHWTIYYPEAALIIKDFLKHNASIRSDLRRYAERASVDAIA